MVTYKELSAEDIEISVFSHFDRTQKVTKCWRKIEDKWVIIDHPFVDNWTKEEYRNGVQYLKELVMNGGYVVGAFYKEQLKGFVSVENELFGIHYKYMNLSNIHVSQDMRGRGIGTALFTMAKKWAKEQNAEKLYISAHSAVESQAFYKRMGCIEAMEYNQKLADKEPCDCQLECTLLR